PDRVAGWSCRALIALVELAAPAALALVRPRAGRVNVGAPNIRTCRARYVPVAGGLVGEGDVPIDLALHDCYRRQQIRRELGLA
ncbi:hypothetical protein, partial [Actinomadura sp. KC216]|uniref:hypothetical protein n=1 Tax=Actinomadura sp. KC216 TaxID=2530370 RepID=UPI001A9D37B0